MNLKKHRVTTLHLMAKHRRDGYLNEYFKRGHVIGEWLYITAEDWQYIRDKFHPHPPRVAPRSAPQKLIRTPPAKRVGVGTAFSKIATPIARWWGADCVDKQSGQLKPQSGCAQRRDAADALTQKAISAVKNLIK